MKAADKIFPPFQPAFVEITNLMKIDLAASLICTNHPRLGVPPMPVQTYYETIPADFVKDFGDLKKAGPDEIRIRSTNVVCVSSFEPVITKTNGTYRITFLHWTGDIKWANPTVGVSPDGTMLGRDVPAVAFNAQLDQ